MVVSLDGYEKWVDGVDGGTLGEPLFLHPGDEEMPDIRLKPKAHATSQGNPVCYQQHAAPVFRANLRI
jgi:hypothetical protein